MQAALVAYGTKLASRARMTQSDKIILFPVLRTDGPAKRDAIKAEYRKRAAALPQWLRDLDTDWIYNELAQRKIDGQF